MRCWNQCLFPYWYFYCLGWMRPWPSVVLSPDWSPTNSRLFYLWTYHQLFMHGCWLFLACVGCTICFRTISSCRSLEFCHGQARFCSAVMLQSHWFLSFNLIDSFVCSKKKKGFELFLKLSVHSPTERICSTYISLKIILHTHF